MLFGGGRLAAGRGHARGSAPGPPPREGPKTPRSRGAGPWPDRGPLAVHPLPSSRPLHAQSVCPCGVAGSSRARPEFLVGPMLQRSGALAFRRPPRWRVSRATGPLSRLSLPRRCTTSRSALPWVCRALLRSPVAHVVEHAYEGGAGVMLMVVVVAVVVLLSWAVGFSVPAAWSPAGVKPKRRGWRQALSSSAVMVSFFLDPARGEDSWRRRRSDGAARGENVPGAVAPPGLLAQVPRWLSCPR